MADDDSTDDGFDEDILNEEGILRDKATAPALADELKSCYWKAAKREVQAMILFYKKELQEICPNETAFEQNLDEKSMVNFKKMFMLWSTGNRLPKDFEIENLYKKARERAKAHYNTDYKLRRARYLLQSSSFLDIDLVYDHTSHFSASYQQHPPLLELVKSAGMQRIFRAITCGICQLSIRSPLYFECDHANPCKDTDSSKFPVGRSMGKRHKTTEHKLEHPLPLANFRLCPLCAPRIRDHTTCDSTHLKKVWYSEDYDRNIERFQKQISRAEDIAFQSENHYGAVMKIISHLLQTNGRIIKMGPLEVTYKEATYTRLFEWISTLSTPAGLFHVALMFGPLMIENGVGARGQVESFGAFISPRALPSLFLEHEDILPWIDDLHDRPDGVYQVKVLSLYKDKNDKEKYIASRSQAISHRGDRPTLAAVKRVYGGAFSGHIFLKDDMELEVLRTFILAADDCILEGKILHQRQELSRAATRVMGQLRSLIGHEVNLHIERLASRLMENDITLKWHPQKNSCQQFVDSLINGEDFEHLFPLFPKGFALHEAVRNCAEFDWPRYLISFNDHIDGIAALNFQPKSILSKYCQGTRDRCDIIDFLELEAREAQQEGQKRNKKEKWHIQLDKLIISSNGSHGAIQVCDELLLGCTDKVDCGTKEITEEILDGLWELPRDTMSLIQFHLLRPSTKYSNSQNQPLAADDWIDNRLRLFRQHDLFASLAGGFGAAVIDVLSHNPWILNHLAIPHARVYGTAHASENIIFSSGVIAFPTYIIHQSRSEIMDKIKARAETCFRILKPFLGRHFGRVLHRGYNYSRLWHLLRLFENFVLSGALFMFVTGAVTGAVMGFPQYALGRLKYMLMDQQGWHIADFNGSLVITHLQKKMRSLR